MAVIPAALATLVYTPDTGVFGGDELFITSKDSSGATASDSVGIAVTPAGPPVALDLDGNGLQFQSVSASTHHFDLNGDGTLEQMAWVTGNDGMLAFDGNHDGQVTERSEFVFTDHAPGARTDMEALKIAFDTNHDYKLNAPDEQWSSFGVWFDANQDGHYASNEFRSLDTMGITSVSLVTDNVASIPVEGVFVTGLSEFTWADGHTGTAADVKLAYQSVSVVESNLGSEVDPGALDVAVQPLQDAAAPAALNAPVMAAAPAAGEVAPLHTESFASTQLHQDAGQTPTLAGNTGALPPLDEVLQNSATVELQLPASGPAAPPSSITPAEVAVAALAAPAADASTGEGSTGAAEAPAAEAPPAPAPQDAHVDAPAAVV